MIKSMTGFGNAGWENEEYMIHVEVKSLNSKFLDLSIRSPRQFSDKELEIRNLVQSVLERGKVSLSIEFLAKKSSDLPVVINEELFKTYYSKFESLAKSVGNESVELFKLALQAPSVISNTNAEQRDTEAEWEIVKKVIVDAVANCDEFRKDEGRVLEQKLSENIEAIASGLASVKAEEGARKEKIQKRIKNHFQEWLDENSFDANRFEQELIYYFEKLDITEELVRLDTHLKYFAKTLKEDSNQGKKLGFISQEIGREINTIGSKANDAGIQRHVILMKDELEKIKEQSMNVI
ncbi:YicC/YloC family endoribonuclease [Algoriphagus vanfongensis]|uniref:YicC/YloC family endoribonuclease n=1 Tax=Algoriphagus vanfongensis TaxID=426371 RepID=UPI000404AAEB|nr:YicC/YloC family endoribonuclease [Algoriphagus vanfongensis]